MKIMALRDQDGDLHVLGANESIIALESEGLTYLVRAHITEEDANIILFVGTREEAQGALELLWGGMKSPGRVAIDLTENRTEAWRSTQEVRGGKVYPFKVVKGGDDA